jgi:hypothetical protein
MQQRSGVPAQSGWILLSWRLILIGFLVVGSHNRAHWHLAHSPEVSVDKTNPDAAVSVVRRFLNSVLVSAKSCVSSTLSCLSMAVIWLLFCAPPLLLPPAAASSMSTESLTLLMPTTNNILFTGFSLSGKWFGRFWCAFGSHSAHVDGDHCPCTPKGEASPKSGQQPCTGASSRQKRGSIAPIRICSAGLSRSCDAFLLQHISTSRAKGNCVLT